MTIPNPLVKGQPMENPTGLPLSGTSVVHLCAVDVTASKLLLPQLVALKENGAQVAVCCAPGPEIRPVVQQGIAFWPMGLKRRFFSGSNLLVPFRLAVRLRRERVDILHVHTPLAAMLGRIAGKIAGTPLVFYTAHGFYFHDRMPPSQRRPHIFLERFLGRWTDHLFTQSGEDYLTAIRERISSPERVTLLGNGIDLNRFTPAPTGRRMAIRSQLGYSDADVVIAFTGSQTARKGIVELLEAFSSLLRIRPRLRLLLIGASLPGDRDSVVQEMGRILDDKRVSEACIRTGFTDKVGDYLAAADLFCLPSHSEGVPRSIIEAMATGLPVVATDIRGNREEVVDGKTGFLVPVGDPIGLSAALRKLVDDERLRHQMGADARKRAIELYDEDSVFERLLSVYRTAVPVTRGSAPKQKR